MTRLDALYLEHGQSPWIDNIRRDWLNDGTLRNLIDRGVRGVTSNPSIFAKALATSSQYDDAISHSKARGAEQLFEELAVADVQVACDLLKEVHQASNREFAAGVHRYSDGFVSLEVSPRLAHDTAATVSAAERLAERVGRRNLMIKIPATPAGLGAISAVLAQGINVNVTLIFSLERYGQVMDAYLEGVRDASESGRDINSISSVASFFVSRVDTAADPMLERDPSLLGVTANAQVAVAYQMYLERFDRSDARELLAAGAQVQRPLWASTSTKNPAYHELLYVEPLVANESVNTMPEATLTAFEDHGDLTSPSIDDEVIRRRYVEQFNLLSSAIDLNSVTAQLEIEGVRAFESSYGELLQTVDDKLASSK